jgi:nucleotide-binding universal stress UspA family protein
VSARAETIGAGPRGRSRRSGVTGRIAGVRVKGSVVSPSRTASVLLASEGREFTPASIDLAADLARRADGTVMVMSIARIHGVAFGLPNPGLMPTKAEWDAQREIVNKAVARLKRRGLRPDGQVLGTRKPAQRICKLADELGAGAIVMGADRSRGWLIGGMMWTQEPQAVERRSKVPVHLAIDEGTDE